MNTKTKGNLILLLAAVLWGSGFISQKFGNDFMPPMTFNAVRQILSGIVLIPIVMRTMAKSGYMSPESNTQEELDQKRKRLRL